jgi:hypothetical protein
MLENQSDIASDTGNLQIDQIFNKDQLTELKIG